MQPSSPTFALTLTLILLSTIQFVSGTPVLCSDRVRDQVLNGVLPAEACCSYGTCLTVQGGYVNVQGG